MTIETDFQQFAAENPHVEDRLASLAIDLLNRGHRKCSIAMLFEVLRWQTMMQTRGSATGGFKLNNNYRAFYARLLMQKYPPLRGFFDTREQHYPIEDALVKSRIVVHEIHSCPNPPCRNLDHEVIDGDDRGLRCTGCGTTWVPR